MTFSEGQQPAVDPEASLRTELTGAIAAAQFALESAIAELSQMGGDLSESRSQLAAIVQLRQQLGSASGATLANLRSEIVAASTAATSAIQQARTASANAATADLAQAASASREQVNSILQGMKDFDPYLQFDSKADEEAYRRREQERNQYIAAQQAKGTPEGDLNAAGATVGQMADAHAHGAGSSPEFETRWNALVGTTQRLRDEIVRSGGSTQAFDDRLRADLRSIMRSKGLSDTEIDARLAAHPDNPLEAAREFVGDNDVQRLNRDVVVSQGLEPAPTVSVTMVASGLPDRSTGDIMAKFRAAGITVDEHPADAGYAHGVSIGPQQGTTRTI